MSRIGPIVGRYMYLDVDGVEYRVYYEEVGEGTPVLLQHTAGADGRQWRHLLEDPELTARYRFVAYDLPFHGKSLPPVESEWWSKEYELHQEFFLNFVVSMAAALEMERAIYIGCSMGGHLAADLALHRPGVFRAAVALEGGLATHSGTPAAEGFLPYLSHPRVNNEFKAALMYTLCAPTSPEEGKRETVWVYSQGAPPVFKGDLVYYLDEHDLTDTAHEIDTSQTQLHVLSGDYDWSASPENCKALADAVDGATYTRLEGVGHFPMSEDPEKFKGYLLEVLERIEQ